MSHKYNVGDMLYHPSFDGNEFYCLVSNVEILSSSIKNGKYNHHKFYTLLSLNNGETYRIDTSNIDLSVYYKKVA